MNIFQITILIIILIVLVRLYLKLRKKKLNIQLFSVWVVFWILIAVLAGFPKILTYLADFVGIGRGVDLAIYVAILIVFYSILKILIKQEELDRKISEIVRKISLSKFDDSNSN